MPKTKEYKIKGAGKKEIVLTPEMLQKRKADRYEEVKKLIRRLESVQNEKATEMKGFNETIKAINQQIQDLIAQNDDQHELPLGNAEDPGDAGQV